MTSSVPQGQVDADDWFDLDKYRQAAGVAYEFSKKKMEESGAQERETIGKGATEQRTSAEQGQQFKESDEERGLRTISTSLSILSCLIAGSTTRIHQLKSHLTHLPKVVIL
jgi:hypothetical protein